MSPEIHHHPLATARIWLCGAALVASAGLFVGHEVVANENPPFIEQTYEQTVPNKIESVAENDNAFDALGQIVLEGTLMGLAISRRSRVRRWDTIKPRHTSHH